MRVPLHRLLRRRKHGLERLLFRGPLRMQERALERWPLRGPKRGLERRTERVEKQEVLKVEDSHLLLALELMHERRL
jgi:hypothetical protein